MSKNKKSLVENKLKKVTGSSAVDGDIDTAVIGDVFSSNKRFIPQTQPPLSPEEIKKRYVFKRVFFQ